MKNKVFVVFVCAICFFTEAFSRNYYLSNIGNDRAHGLSSSASWKTLNRLSKLKLQPGDTVFLKRGDMFIGSVSLNHSGTKEKPIVITAYGQGANPILSGAEQINNWKPLANNQYEATISKRVYDLYNNDDLYTPSRYPNTGYITIDSGYHKDSIGATALTQAAGYWNNATLRVRTIDWVYETRTVAVYQKGLIIQGRQIRYKEEKSFFARTEDGRTAIYPFQKGYGFYLEGLPQMIDAEKEWSWQNDKLTVQLPTPVYLDNSNLQAVVHRYGLWMNAGVKHIKIEGLHFEHYENAGIGGGWNLANITISKNVFSQIHQAAILFDSASNNCIVQNNTISDIAGRGISILEPTYLLITGNTLQRIGLLRGQGWSGVNGATGILIYNTERPVQTDTTFAHHNIVRYNRVDSCGYNGIRVDGSYNLVEFNVIDHCSLTLNDGANLYCFAKGPGVTHHSVFRNNIVRYSIGNSDATPRNPNLAFGIYLDNNSSEMLVEGNTVVSTGASGILNNDASYNNTIQNNTVYNCKEGIGFSEWANLGKVFGMVVQSNLVIGIDMLQKVVVMTNWLGPTFDVGKLNNNHYVNLTATPVFQYTTKQFPEATRLNLSFEQWKLITKYDYDSKSITAETMWAKDYKAELIVNDSFNTKIFNLGYGYLDSNAKPFDGKIELEPCQSKLVYKKVNAKI